jgi:hypothetical protein
MDNADFTGDERLDGWTRLSPFFVMLCELHSDISLARFAFRLIPAHHSSRRYSVTIGHIIVWQLSSTPDASFRVAVKTEDGTFVEPYANEIDARETHSRARILGRGIGPMG